jgi:pimeloyl-ACP methyl ester carboxylesterase
MGLVPAGSAERFVEVDAGRVRVLESTAEPGPGRVPMVLIHGGGTDSAGISWYDVYSAFGADRKVVGLDLPGFGGTEGIAPLGGAAAMAEFVVCVAGRLEIRRAVVIGVSMGGDVALNVALRHPALVEALVLIASGGLVPVIRNRFVQLAAWLAAQLPDRLLVPLARLANTQVQAALEATVHDPRRLPPEVVAEFYREARRPGAGMGYARYNQASLGPWSMRNNLLPVVHRITAPTLFFHGEDDPLVDPRGSLRASQLMPDARLVLVPACGHWAQLESRDRFLDEVRRFLGRREAEG